MNMKIIVGKTAGFCYGVKRAVESSQKLAISNSNNTIYCLGELVHNKQTIEEIVSIGTGRLASVVDNIDNIVTVANSV